MYFYILRLRCRYAIIFSKEVRFMNFLIMNRDTVVAEYIPPLTEEIILKVIKSVGMRVRSKEITEFIMNGYNQIEQ